MTTIGRSGTIAVRRTDYTMIEGEDMGIKAEPMIDGEDYDEFYGIWR